MEKGEHSIYLLHHLDQNLWRNPPWPLILHLFFFLSQLFLEKGRQGERERNINVWLPLTRPPTGDLASNPGMCPDWESNQPPFGLQVGTQSTEPHQPGLTLHLLIMSIKWHPCWPFISFVPKDNKSGALSYTSTCQAALWSCCSLWLLLSPCLWGPHAGLCFPDFSIPVATIKFCSVTEPVFSSDLWRTPTMCISVMQCSFSDAVLTSSPEDPSWVQGF